MQKRAFLEQVSIRCGLTRRDSERAMDAIFQTLGDALVRGERVLIHEFGVFEAKARAPRTARNPRTGEAIFLPAAVAPVFRPTPALKDRMNPSDSGKGDETKP